MDKSDDKEEKRHLEIVTALQKIAAEIISLKNEVTIVRHAINEARSVSNRGFGR